MTLQQALQYLAGGGSVAITTAFISWLAENVPAWAQLQAWVKQLIMLLLPSALSVGAVYVITDVPPDVLARLAPYFAAVMLAFVGVLAGQAWHQLVNKAYPTLAATFSTLEPLKATPAGPPTPPAAS